MIIKRRSVRQPIKQFAITQAIRERILDNRYSPGVRLPLRTDLQREFHASRATIQQAFDVLQADGFIAAHGRAGTVVVDRPPHLHRIALVFPSAPPAWNRFWVALDSQARALAHEHASEWVVFTAVEAVDDNQSYQRLLADVQARRLAGIIFAAKPSWNPENPILRSPIPQVVLSTASEGSGRIALYPDQQSFIDQAVEALAEAGCARVAALVVPFFPAEDLRRAMAARGWDAGLHCIQAVPLQEPLWARNLTRLIFHPDQRHPPDGLIIADDNLVEHAVGGLIEAGGLRPDAVRVIAHGNFPCPAPSVLPVRRLGFDARLVLDTCFALLQRRRNGREAPALIRIPARFEDQPTLDVARLLP